MSTSTRAAVPGPGDHGGDGARVAAALGVPVEAILDLSASLNPFAPDPAPVVAAVASAVARYPDIDPGERLVAEHIGVDPHRLVLTNGGSEAIALVASMVGRGHVEGPEFSLYARHLRLDPAAPRWRSNPNNPLGTLAADDATAGVWDEAFWPLSTGTWTRGDADRSAWVVGSLTKLFACPGLRLGYAIAPDDHAASGLRRLRPRWSVSTLALAALPHLLDTLDLVGWSRSVTEARTALVAALDSRGYRVTSTAAPWVLVTGPSRLRDRLAPLGVVVRDCTSFGLPDTTRIAVPDPNGLERLCQALDSLTSEDTRP